MSETLAILVESLLFIGVITASFVWYAIVTGRNEGRDAGHARSNAQTFRPDADAHLGRVGTE